MTKKTKPNTSQIRLLVLDVDGVLTDGTIVINSDGSESKAFNALDGHGIRMWKRAGMKVAFLSGRQSKPTQHRADQLEIDYCLQDCHDKLAALEKLLEQAGLSPQQVAYIGDDLPDMPPIICAGFGVAVANAPQLVKKHADFITKNTGGNGAVREVIEYILKNNKRIHLLAEGRLINLAAAEGHPASVMDMSFATQALEAEYVIKKQGKLAVAVHDVPIEIEWQVSKLKLKSMSIDIDKLTAEQVDYLASSGEGT